MVRALTQLMTRVVVALAKRLPAGWAPVRRELAEAEDAAARFSRDEFGWSAAPVDARLQLWGLQFVESYFPEDFVRVVPRLRKLLPFLEEQEHSELLERIIALTVDDRAGSSMSVGVLAHLSDSRRFLAATARTDQLPPAVDVVQVVVHKPLPSLIAISWIVRTRLDTTRDLEPLLAARPVPALERIRVLWRSGRPHLGGYTSRSATLVLHERMLEERRRLQALVQRALGLGDDAQDRDFSQRLLPCIDIFSLAGCPPGCGLDVSEWWKKAHRWLRLWGIEASEVFGNDSYLLTIRAGHSEEFRPTLFMRSTDGTLPNSWDVLLRALTPSLSVLGTLRDLHVRYVTLRAEIREEAGGPRPRRLALGHATDVAVNATWCSTAAEILGMEYEQCAPLVAGELRAWQFVELTRDTTGTEEVRLSKALDERIRWEVRQLSQQLGVLQRWWTAHVNAVATSSAVLASQRAVWLAMFAILLSLFQFKEVSSNIAKIIHSFAALLAR